TSQWADDYIHILNRFPRRLSSDLHGLKSSAFNVNSLLPGWHHFVVRAYPGETDADFFVDGILVAPNIADAKMPLFKSAVRSILNTYQGLWPQAWGPGDEAYVFRRALSDAQITALFSGSD